MFHPLGHRRARRASSTLQVDLLQAPPAPSAGSTLDVTPAAREWLALNGFDPAYGARPLRRLVQTAIGDRLAKAILVRRGRRRRHRAWSTSPPDADGLTVLPAARD